jgi:hypothetical protein
MTFVHNDMTDMARACQDIYKPTFQNKNVPVHGCHGMIIDQFWQKSGRVLSLTIPGGTGKSCVEKMATIHKPFAQNHRHVCVN